MLSCVQRGQVQVQSAARGRGDQAEATMAIQNKLTSIDEYLEMAKKGILTEDDKVELLRGVIVQNQYLSSCTNSSRDFLASGLALRSLITWGSG